MSIRPILWLALLGGCQALLDPDPFPGGRTGWVLDQALPAIASNPENFPDYEAIWGDQLGNAVVTGADGTIYLRRRDGGWMASDSGQGRALRDVWASGPDDIWAVGDRGTILHYDGNRWTPEEVPTLENLAVVWGSADGRVFAAGWFGTILILENGSWRATPSRMSGRVVALHGNRSGATCAASAAGDLNRFDGSAWEPIEYPRPPGVDVSFGDLAASDEFGAFVVGGTVGARSPPAPFHLRVEGDTVTETTSTEGPYAITVTSVGPIGRFADGTLRRFDSGGWKPLMESGPSDDWWGTEGLIWSVTSDGRIYRVHLPR